MITNSGTIGKIAIASDNQKVNRTIFQKSVAVLKINKNVIKSLFLMYQLELSKNNLIKNSAGSSQKNILLRDINKFNISLPPLPPAKIRPDGRENRIHAPIPEPIKADRGPVQHPDAEGVQGGNLGLWAGKRSWKRDQEPVPEPKKEVGGLNVADIHISPNPSPN